MLHASFFQNGFYRRGNGNSAPVMIVFPTAELWFEAECRALTQVWQQRVVAEARGFICFPELKWH